MELFLLEIIMKKRLFALIALISICITGCSKDQDLEIYNENIRAFTLNIADISTRMEEIDTSSDTAASEVLVCLDEMQEQFLTLAAMDVPKEFASIENLADEASEYMTEAVKLYHEVFESEEYSEETASIAQENYNRALKRLSYISSLLQGKLPEGEDIIITEEERLDFEPITEE